MAFDGVTVACLVKELNTTILNGKIEKVYQHLSDELLLSIRADKLNYKLLISANSNNSRFHLTEKVYNNPASPPSFCMLLRKHIQNGRIRKISQINSERIVEFEIDAFDEMGFSVTKKLIVEIMGKHSNITLVDIKSGRVLDSIKRISLDINRHRQLIPGIQYIYPPAQDKISLFDFTSTDMSKILNFDCALGKALLDNIQGFGTFIVSAICKKADLDAQETCSNIDESGKKLLFAVIEKIRVDINNNNFQPFVSFSKESLLPLSFYPLEIGRHGKVKGDYTLENTIFNDFPTVSECIFSYFDSKETVLHLGSKSLELHKTVSNIISKLNKKKEKISKDILDANDAEIYRIYGELITANLYKLSDREEEAEVLNYYDNTLITIKLDKKFSPSKNAQLFFKKYSKSRTAIKEKNIQLEESDTSLLYLNSVLYQIESASEFEELEEFKSELIAQGFLHGNSKPNKKQPNRGTADKPHTYEVSEGHFVSVGKNNRQNDVLTFKLAAKKDIWLHTKDIPGSHVILFTNGKEPEGEIIAKAAQIAAYHSKGRLSDNVPVDYTYVKNVRKPSGAKPGMVIFTDNHTLYVSPHIPN